MSLSKLFWWVYQLSPVDLIRILLVCTLVFLWLHRQLWERSWWRGSLLAFLAVWVSVTLWATILNRNAGTEGTLLWIPFHSYRECLDTGNREILRSSFMNVALFYPAGLLFAALLPKHWRATRRVAVTAAVFAIAGLSIEVVQYTLCLGRAEIDDVLHNTLGAVAGCIPLSLETSLSRK